MNSARFFTLSTVPLLVVLQLLLSPLAVRAQVPTWQQPMLVGATNGTASVSVMRTDAAGNLYIAGSFNGQLQLGTNLLTSSAGDFDGFVAKWSPVSHTYVWAQQLTGAGYKGFTALAVSPAGIYVAGYSTTSTVRFGGLLIASSGSRSEFVARLNDSGTSSSIGWVEPLDGTAGLVTSSLAVSGNRVYLGGRYSNAETFGSTTLNSAGQRDGFVARLTDLGNSAQFEWATSLGGPFNDKVTAVAATATGVCVVGDFRQTIQLGGFPLTSRGENDIFVAKLLDTGTTASYQWVEAAGSLQVDEVSGLVVNGNSVYLTGLLNGPAVFGSIVTGTTPNSDAFVAKLTDSGAGSTFTWAYAFGSTESDDAFDLAVVGPAVYVGGFYGGSSARFGTTTLAAVGFTDGYVARLTDRGSTAEFDWAMAVSGPDSDNVARLAGGAGGTVYVSGTFEKQATFGSTTLTGSMFSVTTYLASLTDPLPTATGSGTALAGVRVFPNPVHARLTVQLPTGAGNLPATLTLLDALGRVVRTQTAASAGATIEVAGLPTGLYALRVQVGAATATSRIVIE